MEQNQGEDKPLLTEGDLTALAEGSIDAEEIKGTASVRKKHKPSQSSQLVDLTPDMQLSHDAQGRGYAVFQRDEHSECHRLDQNTFHSELTSRYYLAHDGAPSATALKDAIRLLEARATIEGDLCAPSYRYAADGDDFLIDDGGPDWMCTRVSASGVTREKQAAAKLVRKKGMLKTHVPMDATWEERVSVLSAYRALLGIDDEFTWRCISVWISKAMTPGGPYPILMVVAEQGSGKSTFCRMTSELIDHRIGAVQSAPSTERDLLILADNVHLILMDNLSHLPNWLSDSLCRLATKGAFATRTLFENSELTIFEVCRPVVVNGISDFAVNADLLDRGLVVQLKAIPESNRRTEKEIFHEFEKLKPKLLGAFYAAASEGLRILPTLKPNKLPRMADFALWGMAVEEALGFQKGDFMEAYESNRRDITALSLESSMVAQAVLAYMDFTGTLELTPKELLKKLNMNAEDGRKVPGWPASPQALSTQLRRVAPALRRLGLEVSFKRGHERLVVLERKEL